MPKIFVEIEFDSDTGQFAVGIEQGDDEQGQPGAQGATPGPDASTPAAPGGAPAPEGDDDQAMRPVPSLDAALQLARQVLTAAQKQGSPQGAQQQQGFDSVFQNG